MPITCDWFAMCDHDAIGTIFHPILGDVAICERCLDKYPIRGDLLSIPDDYVQLVDRPSAYNPLRRAATTLPPHA